MITEKEREEIRNEMQEFVSTKIIQIFKVILFIGIAIVCIYIMSTNVADANIQYTVMDRVGRIAIILGFLVSTVGAVYYFIKFLHSNS